MATFTGTFSIPPTLVPGLGWSGATDQPAGSGENAIARWDVVPYQAFAGTFKIGVLAFHESGITKVSFSAENGAWTDVTTPTFNPTTGVLEYVARLDAADFADGQVEIRAIAYPVSGTPRVLQGDIIAADGVFSLYLNANNGGTLTNTAFYVANDGNDSTGDGTSGAPYLTILKAARRHKALYTTSDNCIIYLKEGSYDWCGGDGSGNDAPNSTGWLKIMPAPGVARSSVTIDTGSVEQRLDTKLIHFYNLTITVPIVGLSNANNGNASTAFFEECVHTSTGRDDGNSGVATNFSAVYFSNCNARLMQNAFRGATLSRGCIVTTIGEDAFSDSPMLINCTASDVDSTGIAGSPHPDVAQMQAASTNAIWYGVTGGAAMVSSQGLSLTTGTRDFAVVNCNISTSLNQFYVDCRIGDHTLRNFYMRNSVFSGSATASWSLPSLDPDPTQLTACVVENCWMDVARTDPMSDTLGVYSGAAYR